MSFTFVRKRNGQTMVEMLVAISIVVVSLLGILTLVNRSLGLNRAVSDYYTATYLAEEGLEILRNFVDERFLWYQTNCNPPLGNPATSPQCGAFGYGYASFHLPENVNPGVYEVDFNDDCPPIGSFNPCVLYDQNVLIPINQQVLNYVFYNSPAGLISGVDIHNDIQKLLVNPVTGVYSYDGYLAPNGDIPSKFKRLLIVQDPSSFPGTSLPPKITRIFNSAVNWESRGGQNFVHLQSMVFSWRNPY